MLKKILTYVVGIILITIVIIAGNYVIFDWWLPKRAVIEFKENKSNVVPIFSEVPTGYIHAFSDEITFPMIDVVSLDVNGNGTEELLVTGAMNQDNAVLTMKDGKLIDIVTETGLSQIKEATYGFEVSDIDADGDLDVISAQHNGIFIFYNENGYFSAKQVHVPLEEDSIALDIAAADTNNDGYPDLYVSTFIANDKFKSATFNDPENHTRNIYLHNNGDGTFIDKTRSVGLEISQNTFMARFSDFNADGAMDLLISPNTDRVRIYENNGDGTFKPHVITDYGFWMGAAIGDIDNDGDEDVFLSNLGNTIPKIFVEGDATDQQPIDTSYRLLRNDGAFKFTDVTVERGVNTNIFGWGAAFADFNNDTRLDLVVLENYIKMPLSIHKLLPNPGKMFIQGEDGKYIHTERESGVSNRFFGYAPWVVDLNGDGYNDLAIANQAGPFRIFINNGL
ncbi:MAG: FG-GAP and VCBS repeat-containing protein [Halopseudomonas aestusnigri]